MTVLDQTQSQSAGTQRLLENRWQRTQQSGQGQGTNVGSAERAVSVAAGSILAAAGLARRSLPGIIMATVGGALIHRGATGHCYAYQAMGIDTATPQKGGYRRRSDDEVSENGIDVETAFQIYRSPEELYSYWRNFSNLPRIMTYLQSVQVLDERRSHWVAEAPTIAGGSVEWDAEITRDEPNSLIAWRSLPGSQIETVGEIRFAPMLGDRGTDVHVTMKYVPPGGRLGHWAATLLGDSPWKQIREDLRNFKRVMEIGEVPTINGQPHGTCTRDGGERYSE